jgi:hypothetical protein
MLHAVLDHVSGATDASSDFVHDPARFAHQAVDLRLTPSHSNCRIVPIHPPGEMCTPSILLGNSR